VGVVAERDERAGLRWPVQPTGGPTAAPTAASEGLHRLAARFTEGDEVAAQLTAELLVHNGVSLLEVCEALLAEVAVARCSGSLLESSDAELRARRLMSRLGRTAGRGSDEVLVVASPDRMDCLTTALHRVVESAGRRVRVAITPDPADALAMVAERAWAAVVLDHAGVRGGPSGLVAALAERSGDARLVVVSDAGTAAGVPERGVVRTPRDLRRMVSACGCLPSDPLTERERDVLAAVAAGRSNEQVGRALQLSLSTVKTYLERVHAKLGSVDRASAVAIAVRRGWI